MAGGIAVLKVSGELLRQMLHMPTDCEIIGSLNSEDEAVELLVEHSSIPPNAIQVIGKYRSIHGVTVFDSFDVVKEREQVSA